MSDKKDMSDFQVQLNDLLVDTFNSILKVEENMVRTMGKYQLTVSELHMLEAVNKLGDEGATVTEIARKLHITPPSVTAAVNKLVKKGFLTKERCADDARSVRIFLTSVGSKIDRLHQRFHLKMVEQVSTELTDMERESLLSGVSKLNTFFNRALADQTSRGELHAV